MFRSATVRQADLAAHRFATYMDHWRHTADSWFDGTPASIDERLAKLDHVIAFARDTVGRLGSTRVGFLCAHALPNLEQSRRELAAARDSLLNGFSDRQVPVPAGRRTATQRLAVPQPSPGMTPGGDTYSPPGGPGDTHFSPGGLDFGPDKPPTEGWGGGGGDFGSTVSSGTGTVDMGPRTTASLQRAIVLGSRDFVADQNTDDRDELLLRARRYAAEETSTLPVPIARQIAAAFVGRVEELIAQRPRKRQASRPITHYADFDDSLLY